MDFVAKDLVYTLAGSKRRLDWKCTASGKDVHADLGRALLFVGLQVLSNPQPPLHQLQPLQFQLLLQSHQSQLKHQQPKSQKNQLRSRLIQSQQFHQRQLKINLSQVLLQKRRNSRKRRKIGRKGKKKLMRRPRNSKRRKLLSRKR